MNVIRGYMCAGVPGKKGITLSQSGTRQLFDDPCLCFSSIPSSAARKIYLVQLSSIDSSATVTLQCLARNKKM